MTLPAIVFGILISSTYGVGFHAWRGGGFGHFVLYLVFGWIGFWLGHGFAQYLQWSFDTLGALHIGSATLCSFFLLGVGYWLSKVDV